MNTRLRAAFVAIALLGAVPAAAQSLAGLKIGDDAGAARALGLPTDTDRQQGYALSRWRLASGNDLSISAEAADRIVFMEMNWGGTPAGRAAGLFGFGFGATTLSDIRKKLGSRGITFRKRAPIMNTAEGIVMLSSYEVGEVIATFICLIAPADLGAAKAGDLSDHARLAAISLASPAYALATWGEISADPAHKKIPAP